MVIGAVVQADALLTHPDPSGRQQPQIILTGQRDRQIALHRHARRVHLVRRQMGQVSVIRVGELRVRCVLPLQGDPLLEQIVELGKRPQLLAVHSPPHPNRIPAGVAVHVLAELRLDRPEASFDDRLVLAGALAGSPHRDTQVLAGVEERPPGEHRSVVDDDQVGNDYRPRRSMREPGVDGDQFLIRQV